MTTNGLIGHSSEAVESGLKAITKVEGNLEQPTREKGSFGKDQFQFKLSEAVVLAMLEDQEIPELKDDEFTGWITYAKPGAEPTPQGIFTRGWCKSAEKLQATQGNENGGWRDFIEQRVTLERLPVVYKQKVEDEMKEVEFLTWQFVEGGEEDTVGIDDHIKTLVVGKNEGAAKRSLLIDSKAKRHPEFKAALEEGTLAELLGLEVDEDGKFQNPQES